MTIEMVAVGSRQRRPVEVCPRVWVCGVDPQDRPTGVRFTHVVNCASSECATPPSDADAMVSQLFLAAEDAVTYDLLGRHLPTFTAFVDDALRHPGGMCLVHCVAGENRSVCLAVAYALLRTPATLVDLVPLVLQGRPKAFSNPWFVRQLMALDAHQQKYIR